MLSWYHGTCKKLFEVDIPGPSVDHPLFDEWATAFVEEEVDLEARCQRSNKVPLQKWREAHYIGKQKWETIKAQVWTIIGTAWGAKHLMGANDQTGVGTAVFGNEAIRRAREVGQLPICKLDSYWWPLFWLRFCYDQRGSLRRPRADDGCWRERDWLKKNRSDKQNGQYRWDPTRPLCELQRDPELQLPTPLELQYHRSLLRENVLVLPREKWDEACLSDLSKQWQEWIDQRWLPHKREQDEHFSKFSEKLVQSNLLRRRLEQADKRMKEIKALAVNALAGNPGLRERFGETWDSINAFWNKVEGR